MSRRSILSASEKESLLAIPEDQDSLIRLYSFSDADLTIIEQRRGDENRLGFAIQLSYMRYPGIIFGVNQLPNSKILDLVGAQLNIDTAMWNEYSGRKQTRREHLVDQNWPHKSEHPYK